MNQIFSHRIPSPTTLLHDSPPDGFARAFRKPVNILPRRFLGAKRSRRKVVHEYSL